MLHLVKFDFVAKHARLDRVLLNFDDEFNLDYLTKSKREQLEV